MRESSGASQPRPADGRLAVSTECPTCAAPLDFSEGSNAIRCGHCRSNLLVTGRGQVLSYAIQPRTSEAASRNYLRSLFRGSGSEPSDPKLFFVPFYRVTGHEFSWRRPSPKPKTERPLSELSGDTSRELEWGGWGGGTGWEGATLGGLLIEGLLSVFDRIASIGIGSGPREPERAKAPPTPVRPPSFTTGTAEPLEFSHRHIEKNFIAGESEGLGVYSLGVRSSVLRLELFDAGRLSALGRLLPVTLDPAAAIERGVMGGDGEVVVRRTAGVVMSLIYFPFWISRVREGAGERWVALDGVTGSIASREVSPSLTAPSATEGRAAVVAGFRPLVCPNCGWDLDVSPDDVIFFCGTCRRAWQIERDSLVPVKHRIASIANVSVAKNDLYLPFWIVESAGEKRNIWVPAFRYRQLRHLEMLGSRLSRMQPEYAVGDEPLAPVHGVHYDEKDGIALGQFLEAGISPERSTDVGSPTLVWVPFSRRGNFLFDPFMGSNLYANLLY